MWFNAALLFFSALTLTLCLTPIVRWVALRKGWVAFPKADRWHQNITALMGGIAIFIGVALPCFFLADFKSLFFHIIKNGKSADAVSLPATLFIGSVFLFGLGLLDDFRNIKPHTKLVGQIVAAALVTFLGFRLQWFNSLTLDTMATLLWIVGITNAFNLIDNMDGLCAGVGLVACVSLGMLLQTSSLEVFWTAWIVAGALAGFLVFNFKPAKIFMGDCGSLVIGFCLSVMTLNYPEVHHPNPIASFAVPILILMVPIFDTSLVTAVRLLSGRKASTGGRDHTSHRLVLMGFSEKNAVLFLYMVGAISGMASIFVSRNDSMTSPAVIVPIAIAVGLMGIYLSQLRVYPEGEFASLRDRSFTPILLELTYKRHMLLVILDFILVAFAYYLSYRLRFSDEDFSFYFQVFLKSLPVVIGCKLVVFYLIGIYRGIWQFISTNDVFFYIRASLLASLTTIVAVTFIYRFTDFSKGLFIIDAVFTTGLLLASRGSFRFFIETLKRKNLSGDKILIYGAGRAGELLLREILNNHALSVQPIGFIDDDSLKKGKNIQNFPIFGSIEDVKSILPVKSFHGILISFVLKNGENDKAYAAAKAFCRDNGLYLKHFKLSLLDVVLDP